MKLMPECSLASSMASRVSLVNLQKFTFQPWLDSRSIMMFAPAQKIRSLRLVDHHDSGFRMLEANPLQRVGQLDIDAEIVGIQLETVSGRQPGVFLHVHRQRGDRAVELQPPMLVLVGVRFERDR